MKKILIVEDNEKNMKLVRDILRHQGHATLEAVNGLDGVRLAEQERPDLVLMDIQLPDIDGIEALGRIRKDAVARRDSGARGVGVGDAGRPAEDHLVRLRCLHHEADQPEAVRRDGPALPAERPRQAMTGVTRSARPAHAGHRRDRRLDGEREDPRRRRRRDERQAARRPARGEGLRDLHRDVGPAGARADRQRASRPRAARRDDAGHERLRGLPGDPRRPGARDAAGRAGHRARSGRGAREGARRRRRRLPQQAGEPGRTAGAGALAAAHQVAVRRGPAPEGRAHRAQSDARAARRRGRARSSRRSVA